MSYKCTKFYFVWTPFLGPAKKHRIPDEETNLNTAYHEAGHTLVAYYTKDSKNLHKVTIIPRGQALGYVSTEANLIYCRCFILYLFSGWYISCVCDKETDSRLLFCEGERSPTELLCCWMVYSSWNPSQMAKKASHATPVQIGVVAK